MINRFTANDWLISGAVVFLFGLFPILVGAFVLVLSVVLTYVVLRAIVGLLLQAYLKLFR